jgi:hypothetical protein
MAPLRAARGAAQNRLHPPTNFCQANKCRRRNPCAGDRPTRTAQPTKDVLVVCDVLRIESRWCSYFPIRLRVRVRRVARVVDLGRRRFFRRRCLHVIDVKLMDARGVYRPECIYSGSIRLDQLGAAPSCTRLLIRWRRVDGTTIATAVDRSRGFRGPVCLGWVVEKWEGLRQCCDLKCIQLLRNLIVEQEYRASARVVGVDDKTGERWIYRFISGRVFVQAR